MAWIPLIFFAALIPRLAALGIFGDEGPSSSFYWLLSEGLLRDATFGFNGQKTTAIEPLYPLFLAGARWATGDNFSFVLLAQIFICAVGAVYLYKLSWRLSGNRGVGIAAALLYSFYPYLIRQAVTLSEVPLFTTLLIISCYGYSASTRWMDWLFCGMAFGFTFLVRSMIAPAWLLAVALLLLRRRPLPALLVSLAALAVALPFLMRNFLVDGSWIPTRSGLNLFDGNNRYSDQLLPAYSIDLLGPYEQQVLLSGGPDWEQVPDEKVEITADRFYAGKAVEFIRQNPGRALRLRLLNVLYFFHPRIVPFYPMRPGMKTNFSDGGKIQVEGLSTRGLWAEGAHFLAYGFILLTALVGVVFRRSRLLKEDAILLFVVLGFTLVYSVYWPATRLRAPMDFVLIFYSAFALGRLFLWKSAL